MSRSKTKSKAIQNLSTKRSEKLLNKSQIKQNIEKDKDSFIKDKNHMSLSNLKKLDISFTQSKKNINQTMNLILPEEEKIYNYKKNLNITLNSNKGSNDKNIQNSFFVLPSCKTNKDVNKTKINHNRSRRSSRDSSII